MARRSVLNRSFSTSEKVLMLVLAVLLVVACYYFLVVKNVADTIAANEDRLADIEISINAQEMLAADRARMKAELEALGEDGTLPVVAVYDNIRNELNELNALMGGATTYNLSFAQPTLETLIEGIPASLVQAGFRGLRTGWPSLGFRPAGHPYRHGIHDGRHRHRRQYRLRLVRTVGNQRSARGRLCRGRAHVEQLLCVDHGGQQRHQADRRLGLLLARRHAEVLSGLRLRLSGHVLPRSGASVRVQR